MTNSVHQHQIKTMLMYSQQYNPVLMCNANNRQIRKKFAEKCKDGSLESAYHKLIIMYSGEKNIIKKNIIKNIIKPSMIAGCISFSVDLQGPRLLGSLLVATLVKH